MLVVLLRAGLLQEIEVAEVSENDQVLYKEVIGQIQAPRLLSTLLIYCRRSEKPAIRLSEWDKTRKRSEIS